MKKVLGILIASTLLLGACSSNNSSKSSSMNESKPQFKDSTLVLDQSVLKIKHKFIVNDKDLDTKVLAFEYEVKNKTKKKDITAMSVWIAAMNAKQDGENTKNNLNVGATPTTGKYEKWYEHSNDSIKKGKYAKGIITYELQNDKDVELVATHGVGGKELGTQKIKLDKLKTVDYSASEDINNESASKNYDTQVATNDNQSNNSNSNNENSVDKVSVSSSTASPKQNTSNIAVTQQQDNGNSTNDNQPSADVQKNNQINPDFVKHNDEQSMKWQNENAASKPDSHGGGHPSAYGKSDVPVGVQKKDNNGQTYIDATGK